jgi:hypothetical protein
MSSFPKIIDCVDISDQIASLWSEDVKNIDKKKIQLLVDKTREFITKIYPVLFSDGFNLTATNQMESSMGDETKYKLRKNLIQSALRYKGIQARG